MLIDPRVIGIDEIDRCKSVLTDAHSLSRLAEYMDSSRIHPYSTEFSYYRGGHSFANVIQNLVLYDTLIVDSILLDTRTDVVRAIDLFPGVIRGVHLKWGIREEIGDIINSVAGFDHVGEPPPGIDPDLWAMWQEQDSEEKPLMDNMRSHVPRRLPAAYESDSFVVEAVAAGDWADLPLCCTTSTMTLGRAHYYLELARRLDLPLAADPIRSGYFDLLISRFKLKLQQGTPEQVVAYFDRTVFHKDEPELSNLMSVDLSLPPVAEYVTTYTNAKGCTLHQAVMEVRNSRNAVRFREWCAQLRGVAELGRTGTAQRQALLRELQNVCEAWKKDVGERVNYRTRKLNLESLPLLGGFLKAFNLHEGPFKDPVLVVDRRASYFLFLNDLLRPPRPSKGNL